MRFLLIFLLLFFVSQLGHTQTFPKSWEGIWKGTMYMYRDGKIRDSVHVRLTIAATDRPDEWIWRTDYLSPQMPLTKDYKLRVKDLSKNVYVTDEGNGLELTTYHAGQKLYNVFETSGVMLTSSYEFRENELIFEVTSGRKEVVTHSDVTNYAVEHIQRVVLKK
jgi:hypothetical protein